MNMMMMMMMVLTKKIVTKFNLNQESVGPRLHMAGLSQRGSSFWSFDDDGGDDYDAGDDDVDDYDDDDGTADWHCPFSI